MKEKKFKPCLNKQLLNMFKLRCEWGAGKVCLSVLSLEPYQIIFTSFSGYFTLRQRIIRLVPLADVGLLPKCSFLNNWRDCETGFSFEIDNARQD